jgi:hypothetical protein
LPECVLILKEAYAGTRTPTFRVTWVDSSQLLLLQAFLSRLLLMLGSFVIMCLLLF